MTSLDIHLVEYRLLNSNSYIELPEFIQSKRAVKNIKNANNQCFKWCITRACNVVEKDPQRITKVLKAQSRSLTGVVSISLLSLTRYASLKSRMKTL